MSLGPEATATRRDTATLVRERLTANAQDTDALFVLAALRVREGKVDDGLSVLDRVLVIDPSYPGAWFFKEKVHRIRGESEAADAARDRGESEER